MTYVDGFVAAVPTANREIYKKHAEAAAVVFKEHGALKLVDCWGDAVPDAKVTSFPMAVKRKDDETVVFSWITWPSRKVRDEGMKKVMADPRLQPDRNPMPFDGKRLIYGGFEMIVEACSPGESRRTAGTHHRLQDSGRCTRLDRKRFRRMVRKRKQPVIESSGRPKNRRAREG